MKVWFLLIILLIGIGLGLGAPSVAPKYLGSYFPKSLTSTQAGVEGLVVKKQSENDRLLLTISATEGALLAIFQKKITEISLLVDQGDLVTLGLRGYAPFVNDPPILRVKKTEKMAEGSSSDLDESVPVTPPLLVPPSGDEMLSPEDHSGNDERVPSQKPDAISESPSPS